MSRKMRLLSALLTIAMVVGSLCIPASAISFTNGSTIGTGKVVTSANENLTTDGAVTYAKATYTDSSNNPQAVYALEFNPTTSDYMPYVYSKYTGYGCDTYESALVAESKFGANVVAGVNATFFSMASGSTYAGYWVHDGRLAQSSYNMPANDMITFDSDGKVNIVNSKLEYKIYLNGKELTYSSGSALGYINKRTGYNEAIYNSTKEVKYLPEDVDKRLYYWDTECGTKTDSWTEGIEILCEKMDNGQLSIGNTLKGKVLDIGINSKGRAVGKNEFVLYAKNGSPLQEQLTSSVAVGNVFEISVNETNVNSIQYTEKANAALAAQYPIVKDSVASTDEALSQLGSTFMNARAQRTSIGLKADGSVVLVCGAGRKLTDNAPGLTVYELADLMVQLGCKTAYDLDGGGSTQMVTKKSTGTDFDIRITSNEGTYGRDVANSLFIVKRQTASNELKTALNTLIEANKDSTLQPVKDAIDAAKAVIDNTKSMDGDYTRVYMGLKAALSGKSELDKAIAAVAGISYKDYSLTILKKIWNAYDAAVIVRAKEDATAAQIDDATKMLNSLISMKGAVTVNLSKYAKYIKLGGAYDANPDYSDTGDKELTDGVVSNVSSPFCSDWVGFHIDKKGGTEDGAPFYDVTIDLGSSETNITEFKAYTEHNWQPAIEAPTKVAISVSDDGTTFRDAGIATSELSAKLVRSAADESDNTKLATSDVIFTLKLDKGVSGRFIKFHMVGGKSKNLMFVTELEVYKNDAPVNEALYLTGMNMKIQTSDSVIFTPGYATELTIENANLNWAFAIAAQWDDTKKAYVVTQTAAGNGGNAIKTIPENGFVLGVHGDDGDGKINKAYASKAKIGDILLLNGIDPVKKIMLPGSYIQIYTNDSTLKEGAVIKLEGTLATGVRDNSKVTDLEAMFNGSIVIKDIDGNVITGDKLVGTGSTINTGSTEYKVVVKCDLDGDGKVDSSDALILKKGILGNYSLSDLQLKASIFDDSAAPSSSDYLKLKKYILGNFEIY